jgi:hypothetical protein
MTGHLGFSYIGLIYLLMLFVPNSIWARNKPKGYDPSNENKWLLAFERAGQMLCTGTILFFNDYNPKEFTLWTIWLFLSFAFMILYEIYWVRYFRSSRTKYDFYRNLIAIPVPGATLPVVAFLLLGVYGKVIWLVISSIIIGIDHIGIHLNKSKM